MEPDELRASSRWKSGWGRSNGRPLIVGHRGASAHATENTASAFERAARDGADGVELDVLCCATGEVAVFHDDDLRRLAGRPEKVGALPWSVLRAVPLRGGGHIPLLDEAFEACGPTLLVNVELKSGGIFDQGLPRLVEGVHTSLRRCRAEDRVIVSSFDPRAVGLWKSAHPDLPCALLFEAGGPAALAKALTLPLLRPAAAHPEAGLCQPDLVRRWHQAGYRVNTWTVDEPGRLQDLAQMGVDGIITNDPAAARAVLRAQIA
jgi:glycerophosphoryl diester phosphodiesterase